MFSDPTIIDLLDELDLDIRGFDDASPEPSLLFPLGLYDLSPEASTSTSTSTSAVDVASTDPEPETFELLEEIDLDPPVWVTAAPPVWDNTSEPMHAVEDTDMPLCRVCQNLTIDVPPRTMPRSFSRPMPKENLPSSPTTPTERAFARLRARGSSLALRALNLALAAPEIHHRVLV